MAIIPMNFLDAVVSIGIRKGSSISWIGTGFFVTRRLSDPTKGKPYLVSNKHVFQSSDKIVIRMREKGTDVLKEMDASLISKDGSPIFRTHELEDVDIAVLPLNAKVISENHLDFPYFDIDEQSMTSNELRDNGVDEGALIYMLGYPMGLVNKGSNLPICRLGCIARMSETQIREQHNILVDIQNFPGNSGSPIVLRPELMSIKGTKAQSRSVLVGIIHSYIPYRENLINSQTGQVVEIKSENSGIANVHPVEYIRDIIDTIQPRAIEKSSGKRS